MNTEDTQNELLIFFRRSTGGFQVLCRVERKPDFSLHSFGVLKNGREIQLKRVGGLLRKSLSDTKINICVALMKVDWR